MYKEIRYAFWVSLLGWVIGLTLAFSQVQFTIGETYYGKTSRIENIINKNSNSLSGNFTGYYDSYGILFRLDKIGISDKFEYSYIQGKFENQNNAQKESAHLSGKDYSNKFNINIYLSNTTILHFTHYYENLPLSITGFPKLNSTYHTKITGLGYGISFNKSIFSCTFSYYPNIGENIIGYWNLNGIKFNIQNDLQMLIGEIKISPRIYQNLYLELSTGITSTFFLQNNSVTSNINMKCIDSNNINYNFSLGISVKY